MTTTFQADLDLESIKAHPNNPRRRAIADEDLVESVRVNGLIEPLIVVPNDDTDGYLLVAGHRRLDACRKAKHATAPAIVRTDLVTPGQQLEAMLVENDNRQDLSPIEQAAGYQQLQLEFGYTQKAIAAAVGKDAKTVRSRLQLLKLPKPTQSRVHDGQLAIDDALALVDFADDKSATRRLESALTNQYGDFKGELRRQRELRKRKAEVLAEVEDLKAAGASEYKIPKGQSPYHLEGATRVEQVGVDQALHTDCLAYALEPSDWSGLTLHRLCTDPARHTDQLDAEQARRVAERDQAEAERAEREAAEATAAAVRVETVRDLANGPALVGNLVLVVRSLLPGLLVRLDRGALVTYLDAMDVPQKDRWTNNWYDTHKKRNAPLLERHIESLDRWTPAQVTAALVAALVATADDQLTASAWCRVDVAARRYAELLETAEYSFTDVDKGLLGDLRPDPLGAELDQAEAVAG